MNLYENMLYSLYKPHACPLSIAKHVFVGFLYGV